MRLSPNAPTPPSNTEVSELSDAASEALLAACLSSKDISSDSISKVPQSERVQFVNDLFVLYSANAGLHNRCRAMLSSNAREDLNTFALSRALAFATLYRDTSFVDHLRACGASAGEFPGSFTPSPRVLDRAERSHSSHLSARTSAATSQRPR